MNKISKTLIDVVEVVITKPAEVMMHFDDDKGGPGSVPAAFIYGCISCIITAPITVPLIAGAFIVDHLSKDKHNG